MKEKPNKNIEQIVRDAFEKAEMQPSDNLKNRLMRDLAEEKVKKYKKEKRVYQFVAAILLLLLLTYSLSDQLLIKKHFIKNGINGSGKNIVEKSVQKNSINTKKGKTDAPIKKPVEIVKENVLNEKENLLDSSLAQSNYVKIRNPGSSKITVSVASIDNKLLLADVENLDWMDKLITKDLHQFLVLINEFEMKEKNFDLQIESSKNKFSKWMFLAASSFDYSGQVLKINKQNPFSQTHEKLFNDIIEKYKTIAKPVFAYSLNVQFGYAISKKIELYSGLTYSTKGERVKGKLNIQKKPQPNPSIPTTTNTDTSSINIPQVFTPSSENDKLYLNDRASDNYDYATIFSSVDDIVATYPESDEYDVTAQEMNTATSSMNSTDLTYIYNFLEMPLLVQYNFRAGAFKIGAFTGLAANYFLNYKITDRSDGNISRQHFKRSNDPVFSRFSMSGILGISLGWQVSSNSVLLIQPTYKKHLTSITSNSSLKGYPFSVGIAGGVLYSF